MDPVVEGVDGALGGRVLVWYGSARGIATDAVPEQITQNTAGVPDASEKGDFFGAAPAVSDLNRDGLAGERAGRLRDRRPVRADRRCGGSGLGTGPTATRSRVFTAPSVGLAQQHGALLGGSGMMFRF